MLTQVQPAPNFIFSNGTNTVQNIIGSGFNDTLIGDAQNNVITGGAGKDTMTGGAGADTFIFNSTSNSGATIASADVITDFTHGIDKIDLRNIDANLTTAGDQSFTFNNTTAAGYALWTNSDATHTYINIDNNGNTTPDMVITLNGNITVTASDFVL